MGLRFISLIEKHRKISAEQRREIVTASIFTADKAKALGLIDEIGYLSDALSEAKKLAGIPENSSVIMYRREQYADDTMYNNIASPYQGSVFAPFSVKIPYLRERNAGYYYLAPQFISE